MVACGLVSHGVLWVLRLLRMLSLGGLGVLECFEFPVFWVLGFGFWGYFCGAWFVVA